MKKRYDNHRDKINIYIKLINYDNNKNRNKNKNSYKSTFIKLDVISKIKINKRNFKKKKQNNKTNKKMCYSCGKSSHFARKCRLENVVLKRQFNAMLKKVLDN